MRMPAEWAPHERTIVCWPARETMWQEAFADAKAEHAAPGTEVAVEVFGDWIEGEVAAEPLFDPDGARVRG